MMEGKILKILGENLDIKLDYDKDDKTIKVSLVYKSKEICSDTITLPIED